jgi:mannose-6-phosphate isomerase-like protein (cupin superfamily)
MRFRIGLRTRIAGPGEVVEVAPGVMHSFANAGDGRLGCTLRCARHWRWKRCSRRSSRWRRQAR